MIIITVNYGVQKRPNIKTNIFVGFVSLTKQENLKKKSKINVTSYNKKVNNMSWLKKHNAYCQLSALKLLLPTFFLAKYEIWTPT